MKTIKEYKKAILEKYEEGEIENLIQLSPAKIRDDCLIKFQNGLNKQDLIQFACFFGLEEGDSFIENVRKIENFDIDRFRPFKNFLNKITEDTLDKNAELIAILIDFEPRPYNNYRKQKNSLSVQKNRNEPCENEYQKESLKNEKVTAKNLFNNSSGKSDVEIEMNNSESLFSNKNFLITLGIFATIYLFLITAKYLFANKNSIEKVHTRFMIWTGKAYKEAHNDMLRHSNESSKIALFEESKILNFKKVEVTKTYPFFTEHKKPNLWYSKLNKN